MVTHSYMEQNQSDFLSIKEFAAKIGVHPNTIRRSVKSGKISAFKIGSGKRSSYRIAKTEVGRIAMFDMEEMVDKIIQKRMGLEK